MDELYLLRYCRLPTADEADALPASCSTEPGATRRQAIEDLLWALINTPEFVFKD